MENLKIKRQQFALNKVLDIKKVENEEDQKKYKSRVESLGMIIYKNSLISALAYMKGKNPALYEHVEGWLKEYPLIKFHEEKDFLEQLSEKDSSTLMALTNEVLLFSDALKEFVKAEFEKD